MSCRPSRPRMARSCPGRSNCSVCSARLPCRPRVPAIELRANVVEKAPALGSERSLRILSTAGRTVTRHIHTKRAKTAFSITRRPHGLPFTSADGTAKPRHACASCASNATFGAAFAAGDFGDLCHERSMGQRGHVVSLVQWTRELHYWWLPLQRRAHGASRCVHTLPHGLVWRRLARRHVDGPRMDLQQLHFVWMVWGREIRCDANASNASCSSQTTVVSTIAAAPTQAAAPKPRAPFASLASRTTSCASLAAQLASAAHPATSATSATSIAARATSLP